MRANWTLILPSVLLLTLVAGGAALAQKLTGSPDNPLTPQEGSFESISEEGDFRVTWPSGCNGLRTRSPENGSAQGDQADRERPVIVSCDRNGKKGEGCSVTAIFNARGQDGAAVAPGDVVSRLRTMLQNLGAEVTRQAPVVKEFPDGRRIEGIEVQAAQTGGSGQVWLRGLIYDGTIYIMSAWDLGGNVWANPEYITFFNSFEPGL